MRVEEVLDGAAEILADPERWYKVGFFADTEEFAGAQSFCVLGACGKTLGIENIYALSSARSAPGVLRRTEKALRSAGQRIYPDGRYDYPSTIEGLAGEFNVATWNDAPETSHAEMLTLIAEAKKYAVEEA